MSLLLAAVAATCVVLYFLLPWLGRGVTEANASKVSVGMTRAEVEDILGPPNLMDRPQSARERTRTQGEFRDSYSFVSWGRYVAVIIYYDEADKVTRKSVSAHWRNFWN